VLEVHGNVTSIRGRRAVLATLLDVTERRRAERDLAASERKYRLLHESMRDACVTVDMTGRLREFNSAYTEMLGYSREELLEMTYVDITPQKWHSFEAKIVAEQIMPRGYSDVYEKEYRRKDGSVFPVELRTFLIRNELGDPEFMWAIVRDMTDRKRMEEMLRQSEAFVRNILNTVDEGFIVIDRDYRILTANRAFCSQLNMACDEVTGRHCYEISHRRRRPCFEEGEECAVRKVFDTGESQLSVHRHEDGDRTILVETKAFPMTDGEGNVTAVIEAITDITENHLLEEERLKSQKLESIGTLAGGIAHDFNNLLQGIFGYIALARLSLDTKEKAMAMLQQAEKALQMSVNLTSQLLTFSRGGRPVKKLLSLGPVIENAARFALSGSRSGFHLELGPDLWEVEADGGQIGQVIQNMVLNADQAMPLGGVVRISARNLPASCGDILPSLMKRDCVEITIQDSGVGIPGQYLGRIFDPYFTTKEKGNGLGLATSYSIIRNHDGLIDVRSEMGKGSTFIIFLPASADLSCAATGQDAAAPARRGRLLLMDDDEMVRRLGVEMLSALGHEVEVAQNGEEAVVRFKAAREQGRSFDAVILDLTVRGGMGGEETMRTLRRIDPEIRAVVSSGYADSAVIGSFREHGFRAVLKKPYKVEELRDTLNAVLGE